MKVLIIDTHSTAASAALFLNNNLIADITVNTKTTHSQKLMPIVDDLLELSDCKLSEIDAFYVCEGPGSFTGVRIGIATVKGFAQPFNTPVYTYSSMFLIACGIHHPGIIVTVIDAKRTDVYYGVYQWMGDKLRTLSEGVESLEQLLCDLEANYKGQNILIAGDAIASYPEFFTAHSDFALCAMDSSISKASNLSLKSMDINMPSDVFKVKANYMRKSQAERDK